MENVNIYTDGACSGNPGVGGYAAILSCCGKTLEITGYEKNTTNNRMELMAVISALSQLKRSCEVNIYSDSAYVVNAFTQGWMNDWIKRGFYTKSNKPVANRELWENLLELMKIHVVHFCKVKGHSDDELNNRCDSLAKQAILERVNE